MKWPIALSTSPPAAPHEEAATLRLDAAGQVRRGAVFLTHIDEVRRQMHELYAKGAVDIAAAEDCAYTRPALWARAAPR
jgi:hypothetical protein